MHVNNSKVADIHILSLLVFHILSMKSFPSPSTVDLEYGMSYHQQYRIPEDYFFSEETLTDDVIFLKTNNGSDDVNRDYPSHGTPGPADQHRLARILDKFDLKFSQNPSFLSTQNFQNLGIFDRNEP